MKQKKLITSIIALTGISPALAYSSAQPLYLNFSRPEISVKENRAYSILSVNTPFSITLNFSGELTDSQKQAFLEAKAAWESRLSGYQPGISVSGVTIDASSIDIDGVGHVLGRAGPTRIASQSGFTLATEGIMEFDSADMSSMESNGLLQAVVEHEMGHVLGIGTLWPHNSGYIKGSYQYTGTNAIDAWNAEFISPNAPWSYVPVEDEGGEGTADGHWNEDSTIADHQGRKMRNELMTGWINMPVFFSNTTLQSMVDLGFTITEPPVNLSISINGEGRVIGNNVDCVDNCNISLKAGSSVALEAVANDNHYFSGWGGDCSGDESCNLSLDSNKTVSANFQLRPEPILECITDTYISGAYNQDTLIQSESDLVVSKDAVIGKHVKLTVESAVSISFAKEFRAGKYAQIAADVVAGLTCGEPQS